MFYTTGLYGMYYSSVCIQVPWHGVGLYTPPGDMAWPAAAHVSRNHGMDGSGHIKKTGHGLE